MPKTQRVSELCSQSFSEFFADVWAQVVGVAVPVRGAWYLADGLGERSHKILFVIYMIRR